MIAFCWREPNAEICTRQDSAWIARRHDDEKLAEMTQQEVFPERVKWLLYIEALCEKLEATGLLETVGTDPVTGSKVRRDRQPKERNVLTTFGP